MTPEIAACIRILMVGLIVLFSSGVIPPHSIVKTLQTEGDVFVGGEGRSG